MKEKRHKHLRLLRYNPEEETPRYRGSPGPDCDRCVFIGRFNDLDLHVCQARNADDYMEESVVARGSSEPGDYASVNAYMIAEVALTNRPYSPNNSHYGLLEAWKRAMLKKLLVADRSRGAGLRICNYCQQVVSLNTRGPQGEVDIHCHAEFRARYPGPRGAGGGAPGEHWRRNPRIETLAEKYALTGDISDATNLADEYLNNHELRPASEISDLEVAKYKMDIDMGAPEIPLGYDDDVVEWLNARASFFSSGEWIFFIKTAFPELGPGVISTEWMKGIREAFREARRLGYSYLYLYN